MLQQILRDMWVDPEILAELDETQKQTLFCKMREEQVRRWQLWDQKINKDDDHPKFQKNGKKQVQFLKGEDGEPWVWVMGEHPDDKSIESILAEEARQRALAQAREEAHQLRKSVEKELTQLIDYKPLDSLEQKFDLSPKSIESIEDNLEIYCTVDDLRQRIEALEPEVTIDKPDLEVCKEDYCNETIKLDISKNTLHFNFIEGKRDVLQELGMGAGGEGVSVRVAAWERRVAAVRASDILRGLRARRARAQRDALVTAPSADAHWREQERKAKEAEANMRQIARAAREAHRRSADLAGAVLPPDPTLTGKPPSVEAVVEWFNKYERPKGVGVDENNKPYDWFHGLITRSEAEALLSGAGEGSFLVRVSVRVRGYALSLVARGAPRHYLVHAGSVYRLLGAHHAKHTAHATLADLINHHKRVPITESGGELLTSPCVPSAPPLVIAPPPS